MTDAELDLDAAIDDVGAVVVLRAPRYADPVGVVRTLVGAGLPLIEFTLTGDNALEAITEACDVDGAIVGVGSVIDVVAANAAVEAGAAFVVSPVGALEVAQADVGAPVVLAGFTPTEVLAAWNATGRTVKLFPAASGGPGHVSSVLGPLPQVRVMVSGGVDEESLGDYLAAGAVAVNVGSAVAPAQVLRDGDFEELERRARRFRDALDRGFASSRT